MIFILVISTFKTVPNKKIMFDNLVSDIRSDNRLFCDFHRNPSHQDFDHAEKVKDVISKESV